MSDSYFKEGGPFDLRHSGQDEITMSVSLPMDSDGMLARECTNAACSPGYFKIKPGTGIAGDQEVAYCPYCRAEAPPDDFLTKAQHQYAIDAVTSEAAVAVDEMFQRALNLGPTGKKSYGGGMLSVELSYKSGGRPDVARPIEEELRRDVKCPNCTLSHAVFGLAIWCPDCGTDIFDEHVRAELDVARRILSAADDRRALLGARVAARDVENALEDTVSVFEAVLKVVTRRHLLNAGTSVEEVDRILDRVVRSQFQNPEVAARLLREYCAAELFDGVAVESVARLTATFAKRHPITHNLGVIDKKYLERAGSGDSHGREVRVGVAEVEAAIDLTLEVLGSLYQRLIRSG